MCDPSDPCKVKESFRVSELGVIGYKAIENVLLSAYAYD